MGKTISPLSAGQYLVGHQVLEGRLKLFAENLLALQQITPFFIWPSTWENYYSKIVHPLWHSLKRPQIVRFFTITY